MSSRWFGWLARALATGVAAAALGGEIVFDNTLYPLARGALALTNEFGDEIALAGTARIVTLFSFEYYGQFTPQGDETARVRFYVNDGPGRYLKPQTLLYDSGPFPIEPDFHPKTLFVPNVEVPNSFTWSVEFNGLSQKTNDLAGLLFYDPPTIGAPLAGGRFGSYYDYWKKVSGIWSLFNFGGNPPANFAARVIAEEERVRLATVKGTGARPFDLRWSGKQGATYLVQQSADLRSWVPLGLVGTDLAGKVSFADPTPTATPTRFYRAVRLAPATQKPRVSFTRESGGQRMRLSWPGNPRILYYVQASTDLRTWTEVGAARADADGRVVFVDPEAGQYPQRFYRFFRLLSDQDLPQLSVADSRQPGSLKVQWHADPDLLYTIQASEDLIEWFTIALVTADAKGRLEFTDPEAGQYPQRFYRVGRALTTNDRPLLGLFPTLSREHVWLTSRGTPGEYYAVETSSDLRLWSFFQMTRADDLGRIVFADRMAPEGRRFYRLFMP